MRYFILTLLALFISADVMAAAVTNLSVQRYSRLRAHLTWTTAGADSYTIERREVDGEWQTIATGVTATSYTDGSRRGRGETYLYRVTSINSGSPDGVSSSVSTTVPEVILFVFSDSSYGFGSSGRTRPNYSSAYATQSNGGVLRASADTMPESQYTIAGRISALDPRIEIVNHSQSGYLAEWWEEIRNGHQPFMGEILGYETGYNYTNDPNVSGTPTTFNEATSYFGGTGGLDRVNTQLPTKRDFLLIHTGGNDLVWGVPTTTVSTIIVDLRSMIDAWTGRGLSGDRVLLSTIPPIGDWNEMWGDQWYHSCQLDGVDDADDFLDIGALNTQIRTLANTTRPNTNLVDSVSFCSDDNGYSWKDQIAPHPDGCSTPTEWADTYCVGAGNPRPCCTGYHLSTCWGRNSPWHISGDDNHFSQDLHEAIAERIVEVIQPYLANNREAVTTVINGDTVNQTHITGGVVVSRPLN